MMPKDDISFEIVGDHHSRSLSKILACTTVIQNISKILALSNTYKGYYSNKDVVYAEIMKF